MFPKYFLPIVAGILVLANMFMITEYDLEMIRYGRLISTFIVLLILIWKLRSEKVLVASIFLLLISDVLLLNYENTIINSVTFFYVSPHISL